MFRFTPVRSADAATFRFYRNAFAKDRKRCYIVGRALRGANPETFRALNNTYVTDGVSVWAIGGRIDGADAISFRVCDDGRYSHSGFHYPYGYAKDKKAVYYDDNAGKTKIVRKANPETFTSLGDGHFGLDHQFVFAGHATIPKADRATWTQIGGFYSKDEKRIYYFNRLIRDAHYPTFRVIGPRHGQRTFAMDARHRYWADCIIDDNPGELRIWHEVAQQDGPATAFGEGGSDGSQT